MRRPLISLGLAALIVLIWPATALAATDPDLGTAGNFAVLSGAGMTNTGPSWITGAIGASNAGITGFPPGTAGPQHVGDSAYTVAETDLVGTFTRASAEPTTTDYSNVNLGGLTLGPGVYNQSTAPTLTGTLTLSGGGIYIFWVVGSSATIATSTTFVGNIMALAQIAMQTGATLNGRALARTAAVTLDTNRIIQPSGCRGSFTRSYPTPAYVPPPVGNILPATLGIPWELIGQFPWLLVIAVGAGLGATVLGVQSRRRRRRSA